MLRRIERLEKAVFARSNHKNERPRTFAGAAGGARLLIAKHFFRQGRTAAATQSELEKRAYVYRTQVVQTALNRLSLRSGPLSAFKKDGKKMYVERR